jgi:putative membrane protein
MANRSFRLFVTTALLTAAASVAQSQTTDPATGSTSSSTSSTTNQESLPTMGVPPAGAPGTSTSTSGTYNGTSTGTTNATTAGTAGATGTSATGATGTTTNSSTSNASTTLNGQDATFLSKAVEANRTEIAQAQAALNSAQRSDTKNAASDLLEDHQRSGQRLQQLASSKGWTLPTAASMESDQTRAMTPSGSFDDDRYIADQIRAHRDAIALYRAEATGGTDPELRQFARDQLPTLEHHLEMLQGAGSQK